MTKRRSEGFVTFDFDEMEGGYSHTQCDLYALSEWEVTLILSCMRVARWGTRWVEGDQLLRDIGRAVDLETAQTYVELLERKLLMTGCLDGLVSAVEQVAQAVRLSSCCYEAGPGAQQIGEGTYWGTEDPLTEPTTFGPGEEFETEEAYKSHACEVANGIVNAVIGTLNGLSLVSLFSLTAASIIAGVVGLGLIVVPPVAIVAALLFTGFALAGFTSLANAMSENRQDLVCAIYDATSATEAYDNFKDFIEQLSIDLGFLEIEIGYLLDLVMQMTPIDTFNKLYAGVGLPEIPGDVVDCTLCSSECPEIFLYRGVEQPDGSYNAEYVGGGTDKWFVTIFVNSSDIAEPCGDETTLDIVSITGWSNTPSADDFRVQETDGTPVHAADTGWPDGTCGRYFRIQSASNFNVEVDQGGCA